MDPSPNFHFKNDFGSPLTSCQHYFKPSGLSNLIHVLFQNGEMHSKGEGETFAK